MGDQKFVVRAYGILCNQEGSVLLSDERIGNHIITKFPGGGVEFGEGIEDALIREFCEETGFEVRILNHYYTTGFYQPSAFNPNHQIISVYYTVQWKGSPAIITAPQRMKLTDHGDQQFRWMPISEMKIEDLDLPIDRHVARMLIEG